MSILNSGCSHKGESPTLREPDPPANSDSDSGHLPEEDPGDTSAQGPAVLSLGPPHLDTSPAPSGPGLRTLLQQLPPQDSDERYCLALEEEELAELRLFCAQRRREALGQGVARLLPPKLEGHTCEKCRERLRPGEYGVFAARAGEQRCWHRPCFACQACGQALINLIYFYHNERLYCGRHHAELLKPRCPACDQLIFSQRCTEAEGRRWHENHFCCQDCAGPLGGGRYALPGGGPCCPSCFKSRYSDAASSLALALEGREPLECSNGLQNPTRATVGAAAPHSLPGGGCGRPLVGRGGEGREPREELVAAAAARTARGRAGRVGPTRCRLQWRALPGARTGRPGALRWTFPTRPAAGGAEPGWIEGGDRARLNAVTNSRAALLAAAVSSSPETQRGRCGSSPPKECRARNMAEAPKGWAQRRLETPSDPKEDALCPTCSSSSDSEPDGFFLGQRLPRPGETPGSLHAGSSDPSGKPCIIC